MTYNDGMSARNFDMGRVISGTFSALTKNILTFCAGAIVLLGVPQAISIFAALNVAQGDETAGFLTLLAVPLSVIGSSILSGYIVYTVVAGYRGEDITIGEAYSGAIRSMFGLIVASVLMSLGLVLGFLLLIIPGIIFMVMWSVTIPALVVEGLGPTAAMKRSQELTKGARWPIFWLSLIAVLINFALSFASAGFSVAAVSGEEATLSVLLLQALVTILSSMIFGTGGAIIYSELRTIKEGIGTEQLASVFD